MPCRRCATTLPRLQCGFLRSTRDHRPCGCMATKRTENVIDIEHWRCGSVRTEKSLSHESIKLRSVYDALSWMISGDFEFLTILRFAAFRREFPFRRWDTQEIEESKSHSDDAVCFALCHFTSRDESKQMRSHWLWRLATERFEMARNEFPKNRKLMRNNSSRTYSTLQ